MGLDVYLEKATATKKECFHCGSFYKEYEILFEANITHNLGEMASRAGIYEACWRPEEINAKKAKDIIPYLEKGLAALKKDKLYFEKFNAKNGWGIYEHFVPWVERYLEACRTYPNSIIRTSL